MKPNCLNCRHIRPREVCSLAPKGGTSAYVLRKPNGICGPEARYYSVRPIQPIQQPQEASKSGAGAPITPREASHYCASTSNAPSAPFRPSPGTARHLSQKDLAAGERDD
jgi:hypothetical protein